MPLAFWVTGFLFLVHTAGIAPAGAAEGQHFDRLEAAATVFSNVVVVSSTSNDVYISHAGGFANLKVRDLDPDVQAKLGFVVETSPADEAKPSLAERLNANADPRVLAMEQQINDRVRELIQSHGSAIIYGFFAGLAVIYLFFSFCCMHICKKVGQQPGLLVWLPLVQKFPLLKAAGMSPGWFILWILPPTAWMIWIVWSFKIAKARGKSPLIGVLMLLPLTNLFAFLYLAFSKAETEEEAPAVPARSGDLVLR